VIKVDSQALASQMAEIQIDQQQCVATRPPYWKQLYDQESKALLQMVPTYFQGIFPAQNDAPVQGSPVDIWPLSLPLLLVSWVKMLTLGHLMLPRYLCLCSPCSLTLQDLLGGPHSSSEGSWWPWAPSVTLIPPQGPNL
jgi:hypothetical protein